MQFNCPSCGAAVSFQSSVSVSTVCVYCRSLIVRHDKDVELIGTMAELPPDSSPFQIGTTGRFKQVGFTLMGRMKMGWDDGIWNEWFLVSDEGKKGWLAEAQGFLAISYEAPDGFTPSTREFVTNPNLALNMAVTVGGTPFQVMDVKEATCIASEGELPFAAPKGRKTRTIDLLGKGGAFASIEIDAQGHAQVYIGEYAEFNNFNFSHLRDLTGWDMAAVRAPVSNRSSGKPDAGW